ncbi:MAG: hypothetical protein Q9215_003026 [Flavoplaca cf. flavocitrina]
MLGPKDAFKGGNDLIPCENVTSNPLDFCCDGVALCCDGGGGRFRLDSTGDPFRTLSSAAITATRLPSTSTSSRSTSSRSTSSRSATSISTSSASPIPTSSPVSPPAVRPPLTPEPPAGLSTGAKVAIGIGAAFGTVILLFAAIVWFWWRRKRSNKRKLPALAKDDSQNIDNQNGNHQQPAATENNSYYGSGLYEMPGEQHRELAGRPHYEMPAGNQQPVWEMPVENRTRSLR